MHLIIVEDLESDRKKLAEAIQIDCHANGETAEFSFYRTGEEFLQKYQPGMCDALFLDIVLDTVSGIDTAKKVRETEPHLPIIFTTTEADFALDAFSVHAMDFLVKPVNFEKVSWCLKELREYLAIPPSLILSQIDGRGHSVPVSVPIDDILYGHYQKHRMDVHMTSGIFSTRLSFQNFVALLPHTGRFYICGRNLVVNFSHVSRIGNGLILLKNKESLAFSRNHQAEIQKAFAEWIFSCSRKGGRV